jgi:hypothetical protein
MTLHESIELIRRNRGLAIGIGGVFLLISAIPSMLSLLFASIFWWVISILFFVPVIILSAGPVYCVIAGTLAGIRIHQSE